MSTPAEHAATVRALIENSRLYETEAAEAALDALQAQAELKETIINGYAHRVGELEAERDAARALALERADALFAAQDERAFLLSDPDNTSIKEWHDRLKAERDAAVRAAEEWRQRYVVTEQQWQKDWARAEAAVQAAAQFEHNHAEAERFAVEWKDRAEHAQQALRQTRELVDSALLTYAADLRGDAWAERKLEEIRAALTGNTT